MRPNPLEMTIVPVVDIDQEEGIIRIEYIDAEDGSPVVDIKPYHGTDRLRGFAVPSWCTHWPAWYEDASEFDWEAEFENAR